jgi:hypothetical protein
MRKLLIVSLAAALSGCAFGPVRKVQMGPLGPYRAATKVEVRAPANAPPELAEEFTRTFTADAQLEPAQKDEKGAFRVELKILDALEPEEGLRSRTDRAATSVKSALGLSGEGDQGGGRFAFEARLFPPEGSDELGMVRWERSGSPLLLSPEAGRDAGAALGRKVAFRRDYFVARRAADERLFFVPTPLTLEPREFLVSNDELLLFRVAVGLSRRVQLDFWFGGLPLPVAGATFLPPLHMVGGVAGAGFGFLGAADLGIKVRILDETTVLPGLSLSYDMLDVFGAALGVGGGIAVGSGLVVGAGGGVAAANVQFNLFSLSVSKHFGSTQVVAGTYLLDNHNILPQSAGFQVVAAGVGTSGNDPNLGTGGTGDSVPLDHLPIQVQPFLAVEQVLGPHSALAAEFFPRIPFSGSMGTTGVRWLLGADEPRGPLALDRVRVRVDVAGLWVYMPPTSYRVEGMILPIPWLGLGVYAL